MFGVKKSASLNELWQGQFDDCIAALVWCGQELLLTTAQGRLYQWRRSTELQAIYVGAEFSVDVLALSDDQKLLAAAGRGGQVLIWQSLAGRWQLLTTLNTPAAWIDRLAWQPHSHRLAVAINSQVQVWDADDQVNVVRLNFGSGVSAIDWHPKGELLAVGGYQYVKIWLARDWTFPPLELPIEATSLALAWSPRGEFLASGNLERTLLIWEWGTLNPWNVHGFPGKVKQLCWQQGKWPLLATYGGGSVVCCQQSTDQSNWQIQHREEHDAAVCLVEFRPQQTQLVSADRDGYLYLWQDIDNFGGDGPCTALTKFGSSVSAMAWSANGKFLAAGDDQGSIKIWHSPAK
jgi:WD40 repeat protein